ncbi:hypothetical protein HYW36_00720 [Candidatus Saccharibacteria bacterium]|nr:hypothetical protein [Candidatus Saccharibacteria bacterium]
MLKHSLEGLDPLRVLKLVRDGQITFQQYIGNVMLSTLGGYTAAEVAQGYLDNQVVSAALGVLAMGACVRRLENLSAPRYNPAASESMPDYSSGSDSYR